MDTIIRASIWIHCPYLFSIKMIIFAELKTIFFATSNDHSINYHICSIGDNPSDIGDFLFARHHYCGNSRRVIYIGIDLGIVCIVWKCCRLVHRRWYCHYDNTIHIPFYQAGGDGQSIA